MLKLFNTLTKKIEEFHPRSGKKVGMYTCGPTVYSAPHIGNYRSYIFADVLRRALKMNDYSVTQVMNITDVGHLTSDADEGEDKLEKGAYAEGQTVWDVAARHTKEFKDGLKKLNVLEPDIWAVATEHIKDQIKLIQKLVARGHTYETSQAVYFSVSTFKPYGQLSKQKLADKKTGARSEVVTDMEKKHPADFALWFKRTGKFADHTMHWPSPWGDGFPGWHIECSAMSMKYLGDQLDIHTGGIDHIPVHHENEIAQSESATGKHPFVKYWMHNEFLILPGKRMGKSEGNSITLQSVINKGISPIAYRYLCLQTHYRKPLSFTWEALEAANRGLRRLYLTIGKFRDQSPTKPKSEWMIKFKDTIDNDLNTSAGLVMLDQMFMSDIPVPSKLATAFAFDQVLGIGIQNGIEAVNTENSLTGIADLDIIQDMVDLREKARKQKDFIKADTIKNEIETKFGITVDDTPSGPRIRPKRPQ